VPEGHILNWYKKVGKDKLAQFKLADFALTVA
jgi:hypothetical protein